MIIHSYLGSFTNLVLGVTLLMLPDGGASDPVAVLEICQRLCD
jgi:hypothetical protein